MKTIYLEERSQFFYWLIMIHYPPFSIENEQMHIGRNIECSIGNYRIISLFQLNN